MPTIKTHYGITGAAPFVNVEINADNRLFVDPHVIRLTGTPHPFATAALECIDSFVSEVTRCVVSSAPSDQLRGRTLLQQFSEPWETRLGMSSAGFRGHGGSELVGTWIWDALKGDLNAFVRVGLLKHLEDIPLFVDGVDRDITSDITTRLIFGPLADFTASVVAHYPEFMSGNNAIQTYAKRVWDPATLSWTERNVTLPVANGKALLLVPRHWARKGLLMSAGRFYDTTVLSFAQLEQAVRTEDGKLLKTRKEDLKRQESLERGRGTILRVTRRANNANEDLLALFKQFVAERFELPSDDAEPDAA